MISSSTVFALAANLFVAQSLAAALPAEAAPAENSIAARGGGVPASNPPGMVCYNEWEHVTNDPVVQYWYVIVPDAHNDIKADRVWNHLNLNGCAPTENKYHVEDKINGATLTFHTSEACTAARVSHALRSGSDPGINVACQFNGKDNGVTAGQAATSAVNGVIGGILEGLKNL